MEPKKVIYYAGHIIAIYEQSARVDIFQVSGPLAQTIWLQEQVAEEYQLTQIDYIVIPRLDWQDREFDTK